MHSMRGMDVILSSVPSAILVEVEELRPRRGEPFAIPAVSTAGAVGLSCRAQLLCKTSRCVA